MYKQHATPFFRIVQGVPVSWEPVIATAYLNDFQGQVVWSPCSRFTAVNHRQSVEVVDSVTLSQLSIFQHSSHASTQQLGFSPDSHCLTLFIGTSLISWDLQTGGPLSVISSGQESMAPFSFTHSKDGKVVAVVYEGQYTYNENGGCATPISTYDLLSGTCVGSCVVPEQQIVYPIWTHEEDIQFATIEPGLIRIWQCEFTLKHLPVEVETFSIPNEIASGDYFLFLPTLFRLAAILGETIHVWDAKVSKLLLKSDLTPAPHSTLTSGMVYPLKASFSSDGCFFACMNSSGEVYIWKESPTGYVLHQQLLFPTYSPFSSSKPHLSPNGESIILPLNSKIHQWHTRNQVPPPPGASSDQHDFALSFSLNEKFAAFACRKGKMVTILDLKSGELRWSTNVGVEIDCLGVAGSTVIVVGEEEVITWNFSGGAAAINANINNGVRTPILQHHPELIYQLGMPTYVSTSPNPSHIVVARASLWGGSLEVYDVPTRTCLAGTKTGHHVLRPQFTQDGCEVWVANRPPFGDQYEIIEDNKSCLIQLKFQETEGTSRVSPQKLSHSYEVTDDGWVLSPTLKRLLWLPHHWRSDERDRTWGGQFLGLSHCELSEVVILEFFE